MEEPLSDRTVALDVASAVSVIAVTIQRIAIGTVARIVWEVGVRDVSREIVSKPKLYIQEQPQWSKPEHDFPARRWSYPYHEKPHEHCPKCDEIGCVPVKGRKSGE